MSIDALLAAKLAMLAETGEDMVEDGLSLEVAFLGGGALGIKVSAGEKDPGYVFEIGANATVQEAEEAVADTVECVCQNVGGPQLYGDC